VYYDGHARRSESTLRRAQAELRTSRSCDRRSSTPFFTDLIRDDEAKNIRFHCLVDDAIASPHQSPWTVSRNIRRLMYDILLGPEKKIREWTGAGNDYRHESTVSTREAQKDDKKKSSENATNKVSCTFNSLLDDLKATKSLRALAYSTMSWIEAQRSRRDTRRKAHSSMVDVPTFVCREDVDLMRAMLNYLVETVARDRRCTNISSNELQALVSAVFMNTRDEHDRDGTRSEVLKRTARALRDPCGHRDRWHFPPRALWLQSRWSCVVCDTSLLAQCFQLVGIAGSLDHFVGREFPLHLASFRMWPEIYATLVRTEYAKSGVDAAVGKLCAVFSGEDSSSDMVRVDDVVSFVTKEQPTCVTRRIGRPAVKTRSAWKKRPTARQASSSARSGGGSMFAALAESSSSSSEDEDTDSD